MRLERAADLIRLAREDLGMTQTQLATAAGMQQPTISAYESGAKRPQQATLRRLLVAARARPSLPLMIYRDDIRAAATASRLSDVRVFGSAARGSDTENSDIDLIVRSGDETTLFDLAVFSDAVRELTGFEVDVLTDGQLRDPVFAHVADEAVPL